MQLMALILNGVVVNTVSWDGVSSWTPDPSYTVVNVTSQPQVAIGWSYDGTNFTAPIAPPSPPPLPLNQQYTASEYGQYLIDQFTAVNTQRNLTSAALFGLALNLGPFYILLQCGSLQAFLDSLSNIPVDGTVITTAIVTQFQTAIQAYLAGD